MNLNIFDRTLKIEFSKSGLPCAWEEGGSGKNTGHAVIIAGKKGQAKKALFTCNSGDRSNKNHALIALEVGDFICFTNHCRGNHSTILYKVVGFDKEIDFDNNQIDVAKLEIVNQFYDGKWEKYLPSMFNNMFEATIRKAGNYHCKEPFFTKQALEKEEEIASLTEQI